MKVILLEDVKSLGKKGQLVDVSDGYARNFLLPKGLAVEANAQNMSKLKSKKDATAFKKEEEKTKAKEISKKLEKIMLKIPVKAGENGKIFGGVTAKEISEELKKQYAIDIDKKKIELKETIKQTGIAEVELKLFEGVLGKLKIHIIGE